MMSSKGVSSISLLACSLHPFQGRTESYPFLRQRGVVNTEGDLLAGLVTSNGRLGLVGLVSSTAGVHALDRATLLELGGGRDVVLGVLGLGVGLVCKSALYKWVSQSMTYLAVTVDDVLALNGTVVAGSVTVAGHCD